MAVYVDMEDAQFENVNELRIYPFSEDSSLADRSGKLLPEGAISDARFVVPMSAGGDIPVVRLSSIHVSSSMVSACFVSSAGEENCAMSVTVSASAFRPYFPYRLENLAGTSCAGGVVSFGNIVAGDGPETYFLENAKIHPCCVSPIERPGVIRFVDRRSGESVSGDVAISFSGYVSSSADGKKFKLGLESGASSELASECAKITGSEACGATPISSINGVRPDDDGNIVLWFH